MKKGQSAIEFTLIFLFIMVVVSMIIYILGLYSLELTQGQTQEEIDNFAKSIEMEISTLQKVEGGYVREVEIPSHLVKRFNVTITSDYLILTPVEYFAEEAESSYYSLPGDSVYYIVSKDKDGDGANETYLILEKEAVRTNEYIELS